ncbi:unnamed protein product [Adineta ricciae]|uniref:Uncharacterized protein n=1 Tax=Adineta ricciae TaxID=249248 RepID=A0A813T4T7_ADIRI|nr:unnamed protein product [Adineta ricciae]CAF1595436.1 unnamed protein product [Adineta ricciae]
MNTVFTLLIAVILLNSRSYSFPADSTDNYDLRVGEQATVPETTAEATTAAEATTTTATTTTTITTTTTTTTTTTPAPEVDREWEDLVLAGPTVVNYLSLFMVLVSRKDQILTAPAEYTVKYLSDIQSLRNILIRISAEMRKAFELASDDLIRTQISMEQIPDHIKAGLVLIQSAPNDLLKKLLPYTLRNVDRAANEGSSITKPTLQRFVTLGLWLDELVTLLSSTTAAAAVAEKDHAEEAAAYASDIKKQWNLLIRLFQKFSDRADLTQTSVSQNFIDLIDKAQKANDLSTEGQRKTQLDKLIPAAIAIDQSSFLLDMMSRTYNEISKDHMATQITTSNNYLNADNESTRARNQRQLWQNTLEQSIKVARLAQERQNKFAETSSDRQTMYSAYAQGVQAT